MAPRPAVKQQRADKGPVRTGRVTKPNKARPNKGLQKAASADQPLEKVYGEPPIWAEFRQQLCDALPWFHCTQGAMYHNNGFCYGFLVDADGGTRTHIDEEIIITRIGGCSTKDSEGNLTLEKDQDPNSALVQSILGTQKSKIAVGLIIGDRNKILNRDLPHRFNVMDLFHVTNVWYERIGQKHGVKVRFEKLNLAEKSWWAANGSPLPVPIDQRDFETKPEAFKCETCFDESVRVYEAGWMCLNSTCKEFWKIDGAFPTSELTFNPSFLSFRTPPDPAIQPHCNLVPDLLSTLDEYGSDVSTSRTAWKGIVCPMCGKCIRRTFWRGWKCADDSSNKDGNGTLCEFERFMDMKPVPLEAVIGNSEQALTKRAAPFGLKLSDPLVDTTSFHPYQTFTHEIDGVGSITHFVANKTINTSLNGPDDLFRKLQGDDHGLKRLPLSTSLVAGTLTSHFAVNYGMPYKYVVSVDSKGFDQAPDDMLRALGRLSWATKQAVTSAGDEYSAPNELLTLGYFEEMKIGYHDDGESSLGPTIATLSLGAKATMLVRMKYKYFNGFTKRANAQESGTPLQDDPVLKGCMFESERRKLKAALGAEDITQEKYKDSLRALWKGHKRRQAPALIRLELKHGDLLVMHGNRLQQFFEHAVVPESKLRFALTARYVKPDHVSEEELQKGQFTLTADQIYDGN